MQTLEKGLLESDERRLNSTFLGGFHPVVSEFNPLNIRQTFRLGSENGQPVLEPRSASLPQLDICLSAYLSSSLTPTRVPSRSLDGPFPGSPKAVQFRRPLKHGFDFFFFCFKLSFLRGVFYGR